VRLRKILGKVGLGFAVLIIVSPAVLFFIWMLSLSLKFEIDNASYPPILFPDRFDWKNYADVFASNRFATYFVNSLIVTGTATLLQCWSACRRATASRACRRTNPRS